MRCSVIWIFALGQKSAEDAADISGAKNKKDRLQVAGISVQVPTGASDFTHLRGLSIDLRISTTQEWSSGKALCCLYPLVEPILPTCHNVQRRPAPVKSCSCLPAGSQTLPAAR